MRDPYEVLGVDRNATSDDIHKAFRKRSKTVHPDIVGDRAAYDELDQARQVLAHPLRRDRYDRTGETGDDSPAQLARAAIVIAFQQVMGSCIEKNIDPATLDMAATVRRCLNERGKGIATALDGLQRAMAKLNIMAARLSKRGGKPSLLEEIRLMELIRVERLIEINKAETEINIRALAMLEDEQYRIDLAPQYGWPPISALAGLGL